MSPPFITFPQLNFIIKKRGFTHQKVVVQALTNFHNNQIATDTNENGAWNMFTGSISYHTAGTGTFMVGHSNYLNDTSFKGKVWRSQDNGATWSLMAYLPTKTIQSVRNFGVTGQTVIVTCGGAAGNSDIYRSTNLGQHFSRRYDGAQASIYDNGTGINGSRMVVGGGFTNGTGGVLRWSIDTGVTWRDQNPTTTGFTRLVSPTYAGVVGGTEVWIAMGQTGVPTSNSNYQYILSNQTLDSTTDTNWGNSWGIASNQPFSGVQQRFEWVGGNSVLSFSYTDPIQIRTTSDYFVNSTVVQTLPAGLNKVRKLINFGSGNLWILCHGAAEGTGVIYESTDSGVTWNVNNPVQSFPEMKAPYDMTLNTNTGSVYVIGNYISTHPTNANRALLYEVF